MVQECEVLEVGTTVQGGNPFGEVSSAVLSRAGRLAPLPAMIDRYDVMEKTTFPTWKVTDGSDVLLGVVELDWITESEPEAENRQLRIPSSFGLAMLLVASWRRGQSDAPSSPNLVDKNSAAGLILLPTGSNDNEYYRVGMFSFRQGGQFSSELPWENSMFRDREAQTIHLV
ncbi:hypothetical protein DL98DRAFT_591651 [Cadophora sp. DSE1049]|nr:hypothetical protein DL98DRAFT_591651 [Cadophora sp. DSE1049]